MPKTTGISIDVSHQKIHEGVMFTNSDLFLAVPADGLRNILIEPTTKSCHIVISVASAQKAYWRSYNSGTTFTSLGTLLRGFNRIVGQPDSTVKIYENPVVNVLGDQRGDRLIPAGTGGNASGGSGGTRLESIIPVGEKLLVQIENAGTQSTDMEITLDWYEVDRG